MRDKLLLLERLTFIIEVEFPTFVEIHQSTLSLHFFCKKVTFSFALVQPIETHGWSDIPSDYTFLLNYRDEDSLAYESSIPTAKIF